MRNQPPGTTSRPPPVDVEAVAGLQCVPASRAVDLARLQAGREGQDEGRHGDRVPLDVERLGVERLATRVPREEGVQAGQGPAVQHDVERADDLAGQEPVERQGKVVGGLVHDAVERARRVAAGGGQAVEPLPHDDRSPTLCHERVKDPTRQVGGVGALQPPCPAPLALIEVPPRHRQRAGLKGRHGEAPALRERRGLEAEAEAAEVHARPGLPRIAAPETHCRDERGLVHPPAVVHGRNITRGGCVEVDPDGPGAGRDTVVDQVRERSLDGVAHSPQRLHEQRCNRRKFDAGGVQVRLSSPVRGRATPRQLLGRRVTILDRIARPVKGARRSRHAPHLLACLAECQQVSYSGHRLQLG